MQFILSTSLSVNNSCLHYFHIFPDAPDCDKKTVLDLSKKCLKKVPKQDDAQTVKVLLLDENELQKIDNIDSYLRIEKVCQTSKWGAQKRN